MRQVIDGHELDDDPTRVDRDVLWTFLSTEAYWARWRQRGDVEAQLAAAWRVVGAYDGDGAMVDDGPGAHLRWMLHTRDAHGLYERFGFQAPDDTYLERPMRLPGPSAG